MIEVKVCLQTSWACPEEGQGDTYWLGKSLGKTASALALAEQANNNPAVLTLENRLKNTLEDWFTAESGDKRSWNIFVCDCFRVYL